MRKQIIIHDAGTNKVYVVIHQEEDATDAFEAFCEENDIRAGNCEWGEFDGQITIKHLGI